MKVEFGRERVCPACKGEGVEPMVLSLRRGLRVRRLRPTRHCSASCPLWPSSERATSMVWRPTIVGTCLTCRSSTSHGVTRTPNDIVMNDVYWTLAGWED